MDLFEKYLLSTYRFLNYRLRSEKEVIDNLKKKKTPQEAIDKIVALLKEQRFLNDDYFAQMWVESRSRVKPRSHFLLKRELQQKGISVEIIQKVLNSVTANTMSDIELAKDLVARKIQKYKGFERQEIYQKLGGLLARRGFSWEVSKKAIDAYLNK